MSFKEVNELRKAGKLDEALEIANHDLEAEPENIWAKRATAWVYYEFLKKNTQPESFGVFQEYLIKIKDLQLPDDEKMVFDSCSWQIGSFVFSLQKAEQVDYGKINRIFEIIKNFHFTKPSEAYSFIYKAFHKGYQTWTNYISFADWWDFKNFLPEDYLSEEYNGKNIMAIVERATIAYSKKLLEGDFNDPLGIQKSVDKEKINSFLPQLETIIEQYPSYQYPPFFKAKLLLALGSSENILSAFIPFAKQKRNEFWVWELMAEIFANDPDIHFACYCKALSLKTQEDFLIKLRQSFAAQLIKKELFNEAKSEIIKIISTREKHDWKIPNLVNQWIEQPWYKSASPKNNKELYSLHLEKAEAILYQNIPEEIIAVEFVNKDKKILSFVKNKEKIGFFNYSNKLNNPRIGDILKVRFNGDGQNGFYKTLSVQIADRNLLCEAITDFEGSLKIIPPQNFGFVNEVYIDSNIIQQKNFQDDQILAGKAILTYNKKKNTWGHKAITFKK